MLDRKVNQGDYEGKRAELDEELSAIKDELLYVTEGKPDPSAAVELAELPLYRLDKLWIAATPAQRVRVQNFLFLGGLSYVQDFWILNPVNTNLFNVLEGITTEKIGLASP